jgi:hypothetical protein
MATATAKNARLFDRRDALEHVVAAQGDPVEESQGGARLLVLAEGDTPFLHEVDQEGANLFGAKMLGRGIKVDYGVPRLPTRLGSIIASRDAFAGRSFVCSTSSPGMITSTARNGSASGSRSLLLSSRSISAVMRL